MMPTPTAEAFRGSLLTRHFVSHVLPTEFAGRLGESTIASIRTRCLRRMREANDRLGPASSVRAICEVGAAPLFAQLGYTLRVRRIESAAADADAHEGEHEREQERERHLLIASLEGPHRVTLALIISPWHERLDRVWRLALQTGLNGHHRWCLCFNGHQLRVIDVDRPYARRFLEFDLRHVIEDERAFDLLWALLRPAAFAASRPGVAAASSRPPATASAPPLAPASAPRALALIDQIVAACDAHGGSVREALQHGVRHALTSLATALARAAKRSAAHNANGNAHAASADDIVSQALTMIYRLLFLLFAEARALVPIWHPVYRDSYSIGALHANATAAAAAAATATATATDARAGAGRNSPPPRGLWPAVQAISRLAHDGCSIDDLSVTAFNGQLFAPEHTPLGEHTHIPSPVIAEVLDALMTTPARARRGRERITYADLGVEQLGTVYERVLDYAPHLERDISERHIDKRDIDKRGPTAAPPVSPRAKQRTITRSSARRKESGSFYTPRSMADYLVRVTLGPLVTGASADDILKLRILDPSMGSGAFLVSACRFLAQAHDHARERDGCGGLPDAASAAAHTEAVAFAQAHGPAASAAAEHAEVRRHIARHCLFGVDLNPMAVQLARLSLWLTTMTRDAPLTFLDHHLRVGDSLVGASLEDLFRRPAPARGRGGQRRGGELPLFSGEEHATVMRAMLPARAALATVDDSAATVREKERLLHSLAREGALARWLQLADAWCASWFSGFAAGTPAPPAAAWPAMSDFLLHGRAAFPQSTLDGWLDAIRRVSARRRFLHWTLEFPEVFFDQQGQPLANGGFDAIVGNPPWDMIRNDAPQKHETAALSRFVRQSGLYHSAGDAHFNCYQLFVERTLALLKRGGRFGLVLPWGLAADHGSARLRRRLLESCDLDTLVVFENNRAIFPIHRSTRFALLSATTGRPTRAVRCRFGERDPAVLDTIDPLRPHHAEDSADTRGTRGTDRQHSGLVMTVDLLRHISGEGLAFPDARTDTDISLLERLHTAHPALGSPDGWHAKFGRELNVTLDRELFVEAGATDSDMPVVDGKHLHPFTIALDRTTHAVRPEDIQLLRARLPDIARPRLAFRDIASPTNKLTLIAAMLPAGVVSTHTISCVKSSLALDAQWCLCALLNSFVANWLMRLRVSTHVTLALIERMPVPRPPRDSPHFRELSALAGLLSLSHGGDASAAYARLQAIAARAYALTRDEFAYVLTKFPLVEEATRHAALAAFDVLT
jgi:hypothetical protein